MSLQIKVDGVAYDYPEPGSAEMGDLRAVKREYGLVHFDEIDLRDMEHICALAFLAMRNTNRSMPRQAIIDKLDSAKRVELIDTEAEKAEADAAPLDAPAADGDASGPTSN